MRNNNIKERRIDIAEIIYLNRYEFELLCNLPYNSKKQIEFVDNVVRPVIPYSPKTNSIDIWTGLSRFYHKRLIKTVLNKKC